MEENEETPQLHPRQTHNYSEGHLNAELGGGWAVGGWVKVKGHAVVLHVHVLHVGSYVHICMHHILCKTGVFSLYVNHAFLLHSAT